VPSRSTPKGTEPPRLSEVDPRDLEALDDAGLEELLPGDVVEGRMIGVWDIVGRRLTDLGVEESVIERLLADDAELRGLRLRDVVIDVLDAPVLHAARTTWRGVRVRSGRIGSAELYDTGIDDVEFVGLKLGFVNLRGSRLSDVSFRDCVIDELDVDGADFGRVAFDGCTINAVAGKAASVRSLDLRGADIDGVDGLTGLRGATISDEQVWSLAPVFAREAGFRVE
jgi:uncharacterized protein YjbI with pentapeptide repeats